MTLVLNVTLAQWLDYNTNKKINQKMLVQIFNTWAILFWKRYKTGKFLKIWRIPISKNLDKSLIYFVMKNFEGSKQKPFQEKKKENKRTVRIKNFEQNLLKSTLRVPVDQSGQKWCQSFGLDLGIRIAPKNLSIK